MDVMSDSFFIDYSIKSLEVDENMTKTLVYRTSGSIHVQTSELV